MKIFSHFNFKSLTRFFILFCVLNVNQLSAQMSNTGIFFQAVARDVYSNPAKDRKIYIQSTIVQGSETGVKVLIEDHQSNTDATGVFGISIGKGTRKGGTVANLTSVEWAKGPYFLNLKIAISPIAPAADWDYTKEWVDLGTTPFGTVPYALYSGSSGALDDKLSIADTAKMLAIYAKAQTVQSLSTAVAQKISTTDTAAMLAPYKAVVNAIVSSNITSLTAAAVNAALDSKVNVADSITKYVTPTQLAAKTFDSTAIYNQLGLKANSLDVNTSLSNKENISNKTIDVSADGTSDIKYPSAKAVKSYVDTQVSGATIADANATTKGKIQLAGDLAGTAASPIIANNAITTSKLNDASVTDAKIATVSGSKVTGDIAGKSSNITGNLAIINGGTGATTASGARTNLGLVIGTDVQAPLSFTSPLSKNGNTVSINQATTSVDGYLSATDFTNFNNKIDATQKAANNGVATLGNDGKIPSNQIPAISFQSANVVSSLSAMLAISGAQVGSIAIRTDENNNYVLSALPASTSSNWIRLATPTSVTSVNGSAGPNVVLTTNDVAEGVNNKYFTDSRVRGAINASTPLSFNASTGTISMTAASGSSNGYLTSTDFTTFNNKQNAITAGVDYLAPNGSAANLTNFPTLNQNTTGNAATATRLATSRNINGVGFDGSSNITIAADANTLTGTTLASTITGSNLTSVGTITTGVWSGTTISIAKGGTGATTASAALTNLGAEPTANKSTATDLGALNPSDVLFPSQKAVKTYVDLQNANAGVADGSITNAKLAGSITANKLVGTDITTVGTITTGTWSGSTIAINKGGTGATTAAGARTNLGLVIGTDVMAANATTTLTGDVTGTGSGTFTTTLANSGVTAGSYGSSTAIPVVTVDAKGRVTSASEVGIIAGVNTLTYTTGTAYANGGTISGTTLTLAAADGTNPGLISTGAQTIAGAKTFSSNVTASTFVGNLSGTATTATTAANITATSNTTLTSLANLNTVGTITSGTWSGSVIGSNVGGAGTVNGLLKANGSGVVSAAVAGTDYQAVLTAGSGISIASGTISATGLTSSNLASNAAILNSQLANSTSTLGSTTMTLGGTVTSVTGLTSLNTTNLTATNITGTLSGTATGLTTGRTISTTGDITYTSGAFDGTGNVTGVATLTNTTVTAGSYGSSTAIPTFTVDAKGRITNASTTSIIAGVNTLTYTTGTTYANGATVSGTTLTLAAADGSNPGLISTGAQTIAGAKTFSNTATFNTDVTLNGLTLGKGRNSNSGNVAFGSNVLSSNTTGNYNTAIGNKALMSNLSGGSNTGIGHFALYFNETGASNTAVGSNALNGSVSGNSNSAFGSQAIPSINGGTGNTSIGSGSFYNLTSGTNNIALGYNAGQYYTGSNLNLTNANNGIFIGTNTRAGVNSSTNEIVIGNQLLGNGSNTVTIGNSSITDNYFNGNINLTGNINGGTWSGTTIGSNYGGAGTVTGLLKANGSGVVSAAVAGTDYMAANATTTLTGDLTGTGSGTFTTTINSVGGVSSSTISGFDTRITANTNSITTNTNNIALRATIASPSFTGTPTAPTPTIGDNSTRIATTEYVQASITAANAGVSSVGPISATANANGATISGSSQLILTPASANFGGVVTTATQTFAGAKTFSNTVTFNSDISVNGIKIGLGKNSISSNTGIGFGTLGSVTFSSNPDGTDLTAVGYNALASNTSGYANTAVGHNSLITNTFGFNNTALGKSALQSNTTGRDNFAGGVSALQANQTGQYNIAVGGGSLISNINGSNNAVVGYWSLRSLSSSTSNNNTAIGFKAGEKFGSGAGTNLTSATNSVFIGANTRASSNAITNEVVIGADAVGNGSNTVTVGNLSNTATYFTGDINLTGNVSGGTWSGTIIGSNYGGAGTVNGLLKANGSGVVSAAVAGTDYQVPLTSTQSNVLSNTSGINTGDQTITLTGDVTGTGTGTFATTLANSGVTANTYGSSTAIPVLTVDAKGRVTSATEVGIVAGVNTLTYTSGTAYTNGGIVSGTTLTLAAADGSNPGLISTGAQTIAGAKTFNNNVTAPTFIGALSGNATTATTAGNITATSNTTLTSLANLATVGTITSGTWSGSVIGSSVGGAGTVNGLLKANGSGVVSAAVAGTDYQVPLTASSGISISSGTISVTGLTSSNLSSTAGITNAQLANSSTTLGSTTMTLGGTVTSVTGLTSLNTTNITATNITGTLSGTATGLATGRTISTTGDVTYTSGAFDGTANVTGTATLTNTTVTNGSYGSSTAIPTFTVDSKGRLTAASTANIIADAGTLTGTTLNSTVTNSSLTGVGTITSGTWNASTISAARGGTGLTSPGTIGNILTSNGTSWVSSPMTAVTTLGTFTTTSYANGGTLSGTNTLLLSAADATNPGLLTAGTQVIGGAKTFSGTYTLNVPGTGYSNMNTIKSISVQPRLIANDMYIDLVGVDISPSFTVYSSGTTTNKIGLRVMGSSIVSTGNTTDNSNTVLGLNALGSATTGANNTAFGWNALTKNTTGSSNTAIGISSLSSTLTGTSNVALGSQALRLNLASENTSIGTNALQYSTNSRGNIAIGHNAAIDFGNNYLTASYNTNSGGSGNIFIGYNVHPLNNNGSNEIVIGSGLTNLDFATGLGSNTTSIGSTSTQQSRIYGALTVVPNSASSSMTGTSSTISAQSAVTPGFNGGDLNLNAGNGVAPSGRGGNVILTPGSGGTAGQVQLAGTTMVTGATTISNTTASSSTTTGALIVSGGTGIAGNANIGGTLGVTGATTLTGAATISNTTTSTSTTTGALVVRGGVGVAGNLTVGGTIEIDGGSPGAGKVLTSDANGLASWTYNGGNTSIQTGSYTITLSDRYVFYNGTATATFTLPAATSNAGKEIIIKNKSAFVLTIQRSGSETIFQENSTGGTATITLGIEASNNWVKLVSDGSQWNVFRALF